MTSCATGWPTGRRRCASCGDEQTAGRGRDRRVWVAPPDAALLVSLGFRPTWLAPGQVWRLAAVASLAMAEAAETTAGLRPGTIRLKCRTTWSS